MEYKDKEGEKQIGKQIHRDAQPNLMINLELIQGKQKKLKEKNNTTIQIRGRKELERVTVAG